jgi:hypothetical protein
MTAKAAGLGIIHKIIMFFVIINIIGDIGNVVLWLGIPSSRALSLNTGLIGNAVGAGNALIAGSAILIIVAVVYIVSFLGLFKKMKWAPLLVIVVSVANRAFAFILYQISVAVLLWLVWTIILVILAYLDLQKLKA